MVGDTYISSTQLRARYGGISDMSLWRWERDEALKFPKAIRIQKRRYWRLDDLEEWDRTRMAARTEKVREPLAPAPEPETKRAEVPDEEQKGLYVIVQPSGHKSYAFRFKIGGRSVKHTIDAALSDMERGAGVGITLDQARLVTLHLRKFVRALKARVEDDALEV